MFRVRSFPETLHADSQGNRDVWYFYQEKSAGGNGHIAREHSPRLVARPWRDEPSKSKRIQLAEQLQQLLLRGPSSAKKDDPDTLLYQQLKASAVPSWASSTSAGSPPTRPDRMRRKDAAANRDDGFGLPREQFGKHPLGKPSDRPSDHHFPDRTGSTRAGRTRGWT